MVELIDKRTSNTKVYDLGNGKRRYDFHAVPIHFKQTPDSQYEEIDTTLLDVETGLQMQKAEYEVSIKKQLDGDAVFNFTFGNAWLKFLPRGLRWSDKTVLFQDTAAVVASAMGDSAQFNQAFGGAADLIIEVRNTSVAKIVRINQVPIIPESVQSLEVGFEIITAEAFELWYQDESLLSEAESIRQQLKALDIERRELESQKLYSQARQLNDQQQALEVALHDSWLSNWDKQTDTRFKGEFQIRTQQEKLYQRPVQVWDSAGRLQLIDVELRVRNGKYYLAKLIPVSFLQTATFPIFTDTVTSYTAGAGDGYVGYLGAVAESWSTVRGKADGNDTSYTGSTGQYFTESGYNAGTNRYFCYRGFFPIDTSGIADTDTIDAASLYLWCSAKGTAYATTIEIVEGTQSSTSSLANADFDQVGSTSFNSTNISSINASNAWNALSLNASGLAVITKTGTTKLAARTGSDLNNTAPTANDAHVTGRMSESGAEAPYLSVTTTPAASAVNSLVLGLG